MSELYDRLRDATADALFGSDKAGLPSYTLAEQDTLGQIATAADVPGDPTAGYLSVVRTTLYLDGEGVSPLRWHTEATRRHAAAPLETPPSLPLLVVLTMAAEQMQAGTDMASNNYYGRLFPLLDVPEARQQKLITDYRSNAEIIWGSLNAWLEAWEGERGVPTAYAIGGMRLIGLPMSQAVVRRHDRNGLHHVFEAEGLPPGFRMGAQDMEFAIDPYATRVPSPLSKNLRRLWTLPAARERIVQAACLELEAWTGGGIRGELGLRRARSTRLLAYFRTFPRKAVELNLAISTVSSSVAFATFVGPEGPIEVPTTPAVAGTVRLASTEALSADSLLGDVLEGQLGEDHTPIERRPRRIVPLRWDELQGCFVETERVALGEDNLVLAKVDTRARLERHLTQCARPGWEVLDGVVGVPDGWIVARQVQLVGAPDGQTHVELLPLVPRARTSLTLRGGFVLPGRLRKWSSLAPPEAVALAASASKVTVRVFEGSRLAAEDELVTESSDGALAIVSLAGRDLDDGEYTVAMYVESDKRPSSTATLRLRSADTPLFDVDEVDLQLVYSPDSGPVWPLSAGPADWPSYVNGARIAASKGGPPAHAEIPEYRPRDRRAQNTSPRQVRIGNALPADSCMTTGRHRFQLPVADGGKVQSRSIEGECTTCGLVKRFAATPWAAKKRAAAATRLVPVVDLPPVSPHEDTDQQIAFDALSHVGHGGYSVFERIASQIEGSGLFADIFLRRQEVTGHIDVRRDEYMQTVEWAVNAATLVPVPGDKWVLIGARSERFVRSLQRLLVPVGKVSHGTDAGILRVVIEARQHDLAALKSELAGIGVELLEASPAAQIASALPSLDVVAAGLQRIAVPAFRSLEIWDTASANWTPATSLATTGAFRLRDFRSMYGVRSRTDLQDGTLAIGGAQLVKHIANRWARDPLVGYHSRSGSVVVPLGADLPGLYGRALSLCSGRAPREIPKSRILQYPEVPKNVADLIVDRLMS